MRWILVLCVSTGCLIQPNTTDLCFENRQAVWDACDVDLSPEEEDFAFQACERDAGFTTGTGCAHEANAVLKCVSEASEGVACEDLAFVAGEECSFEQGKLEGCLTN